MHLCLKNERPMLIFDKIRTRSIKYSKKFVYLHGISVLRSRQGWRGGMLTYLSRRLLNALSLVLRNLENLRITIKGNAIADGHGRCIYAWRALFVSTDARHFIYTPKRRLLVLLLSYLGQFPEPRSTDGAIWQWILRFFWLPVRNRDSIGQR